MAGAWQRIVSPLPPWRFHRFLVGAAGRKAYMLGLSRDDSPQLASTGSLSMTPREASSVRKHNTIIADFQTGSRARSSWHHLTWHPLAWHHLTWHHLSWHRLTWHHLSWHHLTWHPLAWHHLCWHHLTWHPLAWHQLTASSDLASPGLASSDLALSWPGRNAGSLSLFTSSSSASLSAARRRLSC